MIADLFLRRCLAGDPPLTRASAILWIREIIDEDQKLVRRGDGDPKDQTIDEAMMRLMPRTWRTVFPVKLNR